MKGARIDQVAAAEIAEIILAALTTPEGALVAEPSGESPPGLTAAAPPGAEPGTWVSRRCSNGSPPTRPGGARSGPRPVGGPLGLFAALTLDVFPLQARIAAPKYLLVRQSGAARAVFTPWPLRPGARAGASLFF